MEPIVLEIIDTHATRSLCEPVELWSTCENAHRKRRAFVFGVFVFAREGNHMTQNFPKESSRAQVIFIADVLFDAHALCNSIGSHPR